MALPCAVCRKDLEDVFPDDPAVKNQPYEGTTFMSQGHYGSTVYDPLDLNPGRIELNICDKCLIQLSESGLILEVFVRSEIKEDYIPWKALGEE